MQVSVSRPNLFWAINYPMIATHSDNFSPPSEIVNFLEGKRLAVRNLTCRFRDQSADDLSGLSQSRK